MYGKGAGPVVGGTVTTAAGIAVLPNTGNNSIMLTLAGITIAIGALIIVTTVMRMVVKGISK